MYFLIIGIWFNNADTENEIIKTIIPMKNTANTELKDNVFNPN